MNVLVTGAEGQLGSDLVPALERAGFEGLYLDIESLDITDARAVGWAVKEARPHVIINCAAYTDVDGAEKDQQRAFEVNSIGPANLSEAASRSGALLIHISTDFVFDGKRSAPYSEADEPSPLNVYGRTKLDGEREIIKRLENYVIVRTSWLYGVHGRNFVKTILRLAAEQDTLRVVSDQIGTPTWTGDLAGFITAVAGSYRSGCIPSGIYHYSNEGTASWYDFAKAIVTEAAIYHPPFGSVKVEPVTTSEFKRPAERPAYSVLDKGKVKKVFNAPVPHWRVSLAGMLKRFFDVAGVRR